MLPRTDYLHQLEVAISRSPVTALLGPRQCGKTTLARQLAATRMSTFLDLESEPDVRRLANPELVLGSLDGLVVLDEIQRMPRISSARSGCWWTEPKVGHASSFWAVRHPNSCVVSPSRWPAGSSSSSWRDSISRRRESRRG